MLQVGRRVRITGHVQGVFFRAWTQQQARELGVCGWVRNCSDGSVEAHLAGDENSIGEMVARMRDGPTGARVDDVEFEEIPAGNLTGFEVRH